MKTSLVATVFDSMVFLMLIFGMNSVAVYALACNWTQGNSVLPTTDYGFAVGSYNDSIFILGGFRDDFGVKYTSGYHHVTEYMIHSDSFHDMGPNLLNTSLKGYSQFWTQQQESLYIIEWNTSTFGVFNMRNKTYTSQWKGIQFPTHVDEYGCLTSSNTHLYVVGGGSISIDTLQTLHLSTLQWIMDSPSMILARNQHACIAHSNYLWSFAGRGSAGFTKNNERISTTDITQNTWAAVEPFPNTVDGIRAVIGADGIYLIGGLSDGSNYWDTVYIMDFDGTAMTLSSNRLVYPIQYAGIILVHDIIYVFGGRNPSVIDTWMYCNLFSTNAPTGSPFNLPTADPSFTSMNTSNPTISPSDIPSTTATEPSMNPINNTYKQTPTTVTTIEPSIKKRETNDMNVLIIVVIGVLAVLLCVSLLFIALYCRERKQNRKKAPSSESVEMVRDSYNIPTQTIIIDHVVGEHPDDVDVDEIQMGEHVTRKDAVVKKRHESNALEVRFWLQQDIQLPQYFDVFINNGYESMLIIKEIVDVSDLKEIGIESSQHQIVILKGIQTWKREHDIQENTKREGSVWNDRAREAKNKAAAVPPNTSGNNHMNSEIVTPN
eukprot:241725_1